MDVKNSKMFQNIPWNMPDLKVCSFNTEKSKLSVTQTSSFFLETFYLYTSLTYIFTNGSK